RGPRLRRAPHHGPAPGPGNRRARRRDRPGRGGGPAANRRAAARGGRRGGGMSTLTSLARAIAAEREHAQPISTVRHLHISPRPLVLIPLALAGEAGAPLAAMVGADPRA